MYITDLSGNEIYCLAQKGFAPKNRIISNLIFTKDSIKNLEFGLKREFGSELTSMTQFVAEKRHGVYQDMLTKSKNHSIIKMNNEMIFYPKHIEFLSSGSLISHRKQAHPFLSIADGQEFYLQLDMDYQPFAFVFGNVVYSVYQQPRFFKNFKVFYPGEIVELSVLFTELRNLPLKRLISAAKKQKANAIIGIKTQILPFIKTVEMSMAGTAAFHPLLSKKDNILTSELNHLEMWNLAKLGYMPNQMVITSSIFSLGINLNAVFQKGKLKLSNAIIRAREAGINKIKNKTGIDGLIGVKTYLNPLTSDLLEIISVGTTIKKIPQLKTASDELIPQVIFTERKKFINNVFHDTQYSNLKPFLRMIFILFIIIFLACLKWYSA